MFLNNQNIKLENKVESFSNKLEMVIAKLAEQEVQQQKTIEDQIESMVGIDKWFNTDNQHKDQEIVKTGGANFRKTWLLMDSKNIVYIDDYPLLFQVLKAEDRGDGTFAMPDFYDGTLRHIRYGDSRELGTFEEDAMQKLGLTATTTIDNKIGLKTTNAGDHTHPMTYTDISDVYRDKANNNDSLQDPAWGGYGGVNTGHGGNHTHNIEDHSHKAITTVNSTAKQATETRMKNTAGQWYILASITT